MDTLAVVDALRVMTAMKTKKSQNLSLQMKDVKNARKKVKLTFHTPRDPKPKAILHSELFLTPPLSS